MGGFGYEMAAALQSDFFIPVLNFEKSSCEIGIACIRVYLLWLLLRDESDQLEGW